MIAVRMDNRLVRSETVTSWESVLVPLERDYVVALKIRSVSEDAF